MTFPTTPFTCCVTSAENLDTIRPLWEQLRAYHGQLASPFAGEMGRATFEARKQELLAKSTNGTLRIELVSTASDAIDIAYCVSTVSAEGRGEIDSLFVDARFRGQGIGSELIRHALTWLDGMGATTKVMSVAYANEEALALYRRFGFQPRTVLLQQKH
jgi:ribosomal protein S18 acetylase RimI-like enzyme